MLHFCWKFTTVSVCQKLSKYNAVWQSYLKIKGCNFFATQCRSANVTRVRNFVSLCLSIMRVSTAKTADFFNNLFTSPGRPCGRRYLEKKDNEKMLCESFKQDWDKNVVKHIFSTSKSLYLGNDRRHAQKIEISYGLSIGTNFDEIERPQCDTASLF